MWGNHFQMAYFGPPSRIIPLFYNNAKRQARKYYYSQKIEEFWKNSRKLWGVLNTLIGKSHDKNLSPDSFMINGKMVTDSQMVSDSFCNFFFKHK